MYSYIWDSLYECTILHPNYVHSCNKTMYNTAFKLCTPLRPNYVRACNVVTEDPTGNDISTGRK